MRLWPALLLAATVLAGCRLIDQRTFAQAPQPPAPAALARPVLPPLPLLRVVLTDPNVDWQAALYQAVQMATARKPDAAFDVLAPIPTNATRDVQESYTRQGQADTAMVATALQQDGIDPARITVGLQGDPGAPPREVRIYVH